MPERAFFMQENARQSSVSTGVTYTTESDTLLLSSSSTVIRVGPQPVRITAASEEIANRSMNFFIELSPSVFLTMYYKQETLKLS